MHKRGLIETMLNRSFRLCSTYEDFHHKIEPLRTCFSYCPKMEKNKNRKNTNMSIN